MSQKAKVWTILLSCIGLLALYGIYEGKQHKDRIKQNQIITTGKIVDHEKKGYRTDDLFIYEYFVNGSKYKASHIGNWPKDYSVFLNRNFPVAYNELDHKEAEMLIFPSDFERLDIPFPDSLKWVLPYKF